MINECWLNTKCVTSTREGHWGYIERMNVDPIAYTKEEWIGQKEGEDQESLHCMKLMRSLGRGSWED